MKKLIEAEKRVVVETEAKVVDAEGGLITLLGKNVLFHCMNYNYAGKLMGVNETFIQLNSMKVVFETGPYTSKTLKDAQPIHGDGVGFLRLDAIESFWVLPE